MYLMPQVQPRVVKPIRGGSISGKNIPKLMLPPQRQSEEKNEDISSSSTTPSADSMVSEYSNSTTAYSDGESHTESFSAPPTHPPEEQTLPLSARTANIFGVSFKWLLDI